VLVHDAPEVRGNTLDGFFVTHAHVALSDTLHRPPKAPRVLDHLVRRQSLVADVPPRARVLFVGFDPQDAIRFGVHFDGKATT